MRSVGTVRIWESSLYLEGSLLPLQPFQPRMQAQALILRDRGLAQHLKALLLTRPGLDHDGVQAFEVGEDTLAALGRYAYL